MKPISKDIIDAAKKRVGIQEILTATIRQIVTLSGELEKETDCDFIHLELGNPGLAAEMAGIEAERKALLENVANRYPDIAGIKPVKNAGSKFIKAFLDLDIAPEYIVPTVGSMQACYTIMTLLKQLDPKRNSILLFNPGFPAQSHQAKMLGFNRRSFDIYDYRGEKMREKLDEMLGKGDVVAMIYSNPNNPSWSNLTEEELKIIGEAATKYDVIVLEDLAYMGMDFRKDYSKPFEPPYIPSVGKYTDNYILMISASKIFSYAGQRIAIVAMSPKVFNRPYEELDRFYEMPTFGEAYVYGVLYTASSGVAHSAQHAMAAMLEKATEGSLPFVEHTKEYGVRGGRMKKIFLDNGFNIVYAKDGKEDISDGFFLTVAYGDMTSEELQEGLMRFGISTIGLPCTGSTREGIRACVSMMNNDKLFDDLEIRLKAFNNEYS